MRTPPAPILVLHGEPRDLGRQHGAALRGQVHANVAALLSGYLTGDHGPPRDLIHAWQRRLRTFCLDHWPWLADEIANSLNEFVKVELNGMPTFTMKFRSFSGGNKDQQAADICRRAECEWWES